MRGISARVRSMLQASALTAIALAAPIGLAAQAAGPTALDGTFRPYLFVLIAFAAGWVIVGAWVFRIGRKVERLARRLDEESAK